MWNLCLLLLAILSLQLQHSGASTSEGLETVFGYTGDIGPNSTAWPPLCHNGTRQSPINIIRFDTVRSYLPPLKLHNYDFAGPISVTNNGHSVAASGFDKWGVNGNKQPYIQGGGLNGTYNVVGLHFHWGANDNVGSEHTFENLHFPLEAHFVHQKANLTTAEADAVGDGLAVVAVWFYRDPFNIGAPLKQLEAAYTQTDAYGKTYNISSVLLDEMIPKKTEYTFFRDAGSLTTPNCNEAVIWTILEDLMPVSDSQLTELRMHLSTLGTQMTQNHRDVQPLHDRKVLWV